MLRSLITNFRKKKPKKLTHAERRSQELLRVMADDRSDDAEVSFSKEEKVAFYASRDVLKNLPPTGKDGGLMQKVATEQNVSRQYIHQVLFPPNPEKLFSTKSTSHKAIWKSMHNLVQTHQAAKLYSQLFGELSEKGEVQAKIQKSKIRFIQKRAQKLAEESGKKLVVRTDTNTIPTTYTFRLS